MSCSAISILLLASTAIASPLFGGQLPLEYRFAKTDDSPDYTKFKNPIKTVAVIGAGPAGIQAAATLNEHNFTVRLFDRQDAPGGNWYYQNAAPIRESYPDRPQPVAAYEPETPKASSKLFSKGDEGLTLDERWREHTRPSPVWDSLHTNSPSVITDLPGVPYPKDAPWVISTHLIQRHIRAFASVHSLNTNDRPLDSHQVTSYATRVELLHKTGDKWTLSLRKLERVSSDKIRVSWWSEEFDAVVIATGPYDAPHVPEIKGLKEWSKAVRSDGSHPVWHSQAYRKPDALKGKNVLIIGASVSASEISRDLVPVTNKLYVSVRNNTNRQAHFLNRSIRRFADEAIKVEDIAEFLPLPSGSRGIEEGRIRLLNGTILSEIDEVILATGFKRSNPFLRDFITPEDPNTKPANHPILPAKGGLTSLHWTGHYIPDPTLAFTTVRPWTVGRHQSLGFARVWAGVARIPNQERLWAEYEGAQEDKAAPAFFGSLRSEQVFRQFVQWLNNEAYIFGGRFVDNWPVENREVFVYYAEKEWATNYITAANFTESDNTPYKQPGKHSHADVEEAFWRQASAQQYDW